MFLMKYIGSSEAKAKFFELIKEVREQGETYVINYKGEPVVRLSSYKPENHYSIQEAIETIRKLEHKSSLDLSDIKQSVQWGRR